MKRISIPLAVLVALVVAACSSEEASTTPSPATPEPTVAATPEPTADPEPAESALALPSIDLDGDPELAGRFPETVGGEPLEIQSLDGEAFAAFGNDPVFDDFLGAIGAEPSDVSVAFGGAAIGEGVLSAGAFRVRGASQDELAREFIAASEQGGDVPELSQETIGGKEVWTATDDTSGTEVQVFIYTKDDTLYFLTGSLEHATEILEALP